MDRKDALEAIRDFWHKTVGSMSSEDYAWIVGEVRADLVGYQMCIDDEAEDE